ncbi:DinB family protein [Rubrolithibacter danxiaensis]|uniref:DinB family protein n=1 Tax=Rubrolithibacter danxiaensis TaxID=3390805 RepID=UPI003BF85A78
MNIKRISDSIKTSIEKYQEVLKTFTEEEFQQTPAPGVWSYSEVYSHITRANSASLLAIEKCLHQTKPVKSEGISLLARLVLFAGRFPPVKLKAPEKMAAMVTKISKEEASNELVKFLHKIEGLVPRIYKCNNSSKIQHPRLGMLNACQWFRFIEIHSKHHLRQLSRIKKMLSLQN